MDEARFFELFFNNTLKTKVCRLCLAEESNIMYYNIHKDSYKMFNPISELLEETSLPVHVNDIYPEIVCQRCLDSAINAFNFKSMCNQSNIQLNEYFSMLQEKVSECKLKSEGENSILFLVPDSDMFSRNKNNESTSIKDDLENSVKKELFDYEYVLQEELEKIKNFDLEDTELNVLESYSCPQCQVSFFNMFDLQQHMITGIHSTECMICHLTCIDTLHLKKHLSEHNKKQEVICQHCGDFVKNGAHTTAVFSYLCNICGQKYPCQKFLDRHIENIHRSSNCNIAQSANENRNEENKLTPPVFYGCKQCKHKFVSETALYKHTKQHDKIFICDYCGSSQKTKWALIRHINVHFGVRSFTCDICSKSFYSRAEMMSHRKTHTSGQRFQCDICGGKFVTNMALLYHRRLHTGETPYPCQQCDMKFLSASRRLDHVRMKHMEKPECPVCFKKIAHKHLSTHLKNHSTMKGVNNGTT